MSHINEPVLKPVYLTPFLTFITFRTFTTFTFVRLSPIHMKISQTQSEKNKVGYPTEDAPSPRFSLTLTDPRTHGLTAANTASWLLLLLLTGGIQPGREDSAWHARRQRPRSDHSGCIGSTDRFFCRPRRLLRPNSICHMGSETRYV